MIAINILLAVVAFILMIYIIGNFNPPISTEQRKCITAAFVAVLAFILLFNILI